MPRCDEVHPLIERLTNNASLSGDLARDVDALLMRHGRNITREHVPRVSRLACELAKRFGLDPNKAETAALLHDVGGIIDRSDMVKAAESLGVALFPEEREVPMIVHQKLSVVLAREVFSVTNEAVLSAIRYHTTLHAAPTPLEELIFVADKLEWNQKGEPPYRAELLSALEGGVTAAARWMIELMWETRDELLVIHPWFKEAYLHYRSL